MRAQDLSIITLVWHKRDEKVDSTFEQEVIFFLVFSGLNLDRLQSRNLYPNMLGQSMVCPLNFSWYPSPCSFVCLKDRFQGLLYPHTLGTLLSGQYA